MKKKTNSLVWILGIVVALGATAWLGGTQLGWFKAEEEKSVAGVAARRGPLRISVLQRGNLEAANSEVIRSQLEGRSTILSLIEEGVFAKEGELVAELDASELEDDLVNRGISLENARSSVTKAEQSLEIQKSANASDIAKAEQDLDFARTDEEKYLKGDWEQQQKEADESIKLAEEELAQAQDQLNWSIRLEKDGFLTRTRLEEDRLRAERSKIGLEQAQRKKGLLIKYENPKEVKRLRAAVTEAERELERVRLQAAAKLVDFESELRTSRARLNLEEEKYAKLKSQIEAAKIYAPVSGMVVYGRTEGRRSSEPITEGTEVWERQEILTIPQAGGMIVEASLHESVLKKVQVGQPAIIKVDALTGLEFDGMVDFVAHLADKNSWWANPDQRVYRAEITISNPNEEMRPGMSCSLEIIIADLEDTIYLPVQCVLYHLGETICFIERDGEVEMRKVEIGLSSEKWIEIRSGMEEGEIALLSPPSGFVAQPAPEKKPGRQDKGRPNGGPEVGMAGDNLQSRSGDAKSFRTGNAGRDSRKDKSPSGAKKVSKNKDATAAKSGGNPGAFTKPPAQ